MQRLVITAATLMVASPTAILAQEHKVYESPEAMQWQDGPPSLPDGAEMVVLAGDPTADSGQFAVRLRVPAGYEVPPHSHPTTEQVTVLSGQFGIGMGDTMDKGAGTMFQVGGFANMPANENHFAWTEDGATFQIQGQSPFDVKYVNPDDDPRN